MLAIVANEFDKKKKKKSFIIQNFIHNPKLFWAME